VKPTVEGPGLYRQRVADLVPQRLRGSQGGVGLEEEVIPDKPADAPLLGSPRVGRESADHLVLAPAPGSGFRRLTSILAGDMGPTRAEGGSRQFEEADGRIPCGLMLGLTHGGDSERRPATIPERDPLVARDRADLQGKRQQTVDADGQVRHDLGRPSVHRRAEGPAA
jgi:hypothetical protein